jgi:hypothetical protein
LVAGAVAAARRPVRRKQSSASVSSLQAATLVCALPLDLREVANATRPLVLSVVLCATVSRAPLLLVVLSTAVATPLVAIAAAAPTPIISPVADPYPLHGSKGFGKVTPSEIFYGGDPTGLVCSIRWTSWGGRIARGYGTGWYIHGDQSVAQGHQALAFLVASSLASWKGRPAYRRLTWSFPDGGRRRARSCAA